MSILIESDAQVSSRTDSDGTRDISKENDLRTVRERSPM